MPALNQSLMIATAKGRFDQSTRVLAMSQKQAPQDVGALIEPLCKAVSSAHEQWRRQAFLRGLRINGPVATGGSLEGPALEPLIRPGLTPLAGKSWAVRYGAAVAASLGEAWTEYQRSFSVPGLMWYPTFAAFPGPMAPPTPNVPTPLAACAMDRSRIAASGLKERMTRRLGAPGPLSTQLFESIAQAFEAAIVQWLSVQMITNVLGKGPVPTFAPPYVPVGPVVMGDNVAVPGHLVA
jgi:hypothetical protein